MKEGESAVWSRSTGDMSHGNLPGGSLVQSINGNSRKTAASLAHPGLGYALLEFDGLWQRLLCLAPAWTSLQFSLPGTHNRKAHIYKVHILYKISYLVSEKSSWGVRICYWKQIMLVFFVNLETLHVSSRLNFFSTANATYICWNMLMSDMNQLTWLLGFPSATLLWSWPRSNIAWYLGQPPQKKECLVN